MLTITFHRGDKIKLDDNHEGIYWRAHPTKKGYSTVVAADMFGDPKVIDVPDRRITRG
jgi:hypothetical protein